MAPLLRRALEALVIALLLSVVSPARAAGAADAADDGDCFDARGCPIDLSDLEDADAAGDAGASDAGSDAVTARDERDAAAPPATHLVFFWGVGCTHCEDAKPFVAALGKERPDLTIELVEVRQDAKGRERFLETMRSLGATAVGVPTFVVGRRYVVGFAPGQSEAEIRALLGQGPQTEARTVDLPLVGRVDPAAIPLPVFTLMIGLVDGINPCAMWVLLVLLSILIHVKSRARLFLFGATFVVASGVVYFAFMTAWTQVFALVGLSRHLTLALGVVVLLMGLVNLKELIWFEKGVSLMIPDKAKPGLYRRMRGISRSASLPAAFAGIAVLAFVVNLIELGCTLGLPAIYTRILTLRTDLSTATRYGYLVLYNLAYVVPLALIVVVYAATLHRITLGERGAKVLKGVSGVLLVAFGALFLVAPDVLR